MTQRKIGHPNRKDHHEDTRQARQRGRPGAPRAARPPDRGGRGSLPQPGHAPQPTGPPGAASSNGATARDWTRCQPLRSPSPPTWPNVRKRGHLATVRLDRFAIRWAHEQAGHPGVRRVVKGLGRTAAREGRPAHSGRARGDQGHRTAPPGRANGAHGIPTAAVQVAGRWASGRMPRVLRARRARRAGCRRQLLRAIGGAPSVTGLRGGWGCPPRPGAPWAA